MISEVTEKDGNKELDALAGKATTGIPLGTWASFEKDYAPNPEWLEAGTTFDANAFPALAMYLGGTKVPERFDHNRAGEWEEITLPSTLATAFTAPFDCDITLQSSYGTDAYVFVNGSQLSNWCNVANGGGVSVTGWWSLRKGDTIYGTGLGKGYSNRTPMRIRYYKHPMFIKATPTSSNSDYQGTLQAVMQYIRNMNSYSTEEKWTGGYWIDGKKIYRKCTQYYKDGQLYGGCSITNKQLSGVLPSDYDTIINYNMVNLGMDNSSTKFWDKIVGSRQYNYRINIYETNNVKATSVYVDIGYYTYNGWFTIEYTKTTD